LKDIRKEIGGLQDRFSKLDEELDYIQDQQQLTKYFDVDEAAMRSLNEESDEAVE
jgi:hypothetical protein